MDDDYKEKERYLLSDLCIPVGEQKSHLPLILRVYGGPWWIRDTWEYRADVQWFANRGYACLQINYRGSAGYGKQFLYVGGKMQDDVIYAVNWAIQQVAADPQKIATYGNSYGGYAALFAATFTPDIFCCAVCISGDANLLSATSICPSYWPSMRASFYQRIGHPITEIAFLQSRSPAFHAHRINIPVLIAMGENDPRVPRTDMEGIEQAMQKTGVPCEYLLFPDEGHTFTKRENRLLFYARAERFLSHYLSGRCEG